jgi:signal transduction histidine kinase
VAELANRGNFGLMGLKERAQLFDGHVSVISQPDQGTEVQVILPRSVHGPVVPAASPALSGALPAKAVPVEARRASQ